MRYQDHRNSIILRDETFLAGYIATPGDFGTL